jgi:type IV secretory pathway VirD2 relaxase
MRRPGSRLGRGHVAAKFAGRALSGNSRRVAIKTRLVNLRQVGTRSTAMHLRYIEREGVGPNGEPGKAYGPSSEDADLDAFEQRGQDDRHQFRFIVSPEDAAELGDLQRYTRHLMQRMEADLGTSLDWVAVDHWNTDNPHTHIVMRGKDDSGKDLIVSRDYIAHGMRERASALATEWLGPRTEQEIRLSLQHQVEQGRWTSLDQSLQHAAQEGRIRLGSLKHETGQSVLVGRLHYLERLGLATTEAPGHWHLRSDTEAVLRLGSADVQGFEMEELMHSKAAALAVLHYLFGRLDERFDGAPTLLILDEAWLFLDDPIFASRIRQWLKTLRKKNVSVVFATQSLADIRESTIAPAIIESCASRIFLPNPQATEPQIRAVYESFGLNSRQIGIVAQAQPKRDYYYQSRLGNRVFDLDLGPVALAFAAASSPEDQRRIDDVLESRPPDGFPAAWLRHRDLRWAADLASSFPTPPEIVS